MNIALVLGGYVNGYNIVRELHRFGVREIVLFDYGHSLARFSNKVGKVIEIKPDVEVLKAAIQKLHDGKNYIVIFPTDDIQLELLNEVRNSIETYCFLPFNANSLPKDITKHYQYETCERIGVPFPRSINISNATEIYRIRELTFPIIVKPSKRDDLRFNTFRNVYIEKVEYLDGYLSKLTQCLDLQISIIASEFIPGDDNKVFAYTAYRSRDGRILNEWTGRKLSQHPDAFGVFSSACNDAPEAVREQGRALLEAMNLHGIAEPEFKYDERDGRYKLMEINLRSMMWHRTGHLSGVYLQYTQWLDAVGAFVPRYQQRSTPLVHFVYMKHEISNLLARRGYFGRFRRNIMGECDIHFAVFDWTDPVPFVIDFMTLPRVIVGRWLKALFRR